MTDPNNILKMTPTETPIATQKRCSVTWNQDYILFEIKYMFYSRAWTCAQEESNYPPVTAKTAGKERNGFLKVKRERSASKW